MIKVPYTVTADIAKYEGAVFNPNPDPGYIAQKSVELDKSGLSLAEAETLIEKLSLYCGFQKTADIREVALQLEEDIAVLHKGRLVAICFCFPSGFAPAEKLGQSFMEMHAPVADNQKLQRASDKVVEMISKSDALYRRHVWTLTSSPRLSRHPDYRAEEPPASTVDSLFFRSETQTTVGVGEDTSFFFVKVEVKPFAELSQELQQTVISSINTMSDAVLEYKGLTHIKKLINA